jgi:hypothetical protein
MYVYIYYTTDWKLLERDIFILGCETWLKPTITNQEIIPPGYEVYRNDRHDWYGGVLVIVKSSVCYISSIVDVDDLSKAKFRFCGNEVFVYLFRIHAAGDCICMPVYIWCETWLKPTKK